MKRRGALDAVVNLAPFERLRAFEAQASRLKRTDAARNDDGAREKRSVSRSAHPEALLAALADLCDLLSEVKGRVKRLDLLQQPVDEFLGAAHRQRRNVVDRLVGIELGALTAGMGERVDDVRRDPEQPELEDLEQPARSCADDHDVALDR